MNNGVVKGILFLFCIYTVSNPRKNDIINHWSCYHFVDAFSTLRPRAMPLKSYYAVSEKPFPRTAVTSLFLFSTRNKNEDDDEDDDDNWEETATSPKEVTPSDIVSPFEATSEPAAPIKDNLAFTPENVDIVLEEVRPYLISDGGNVAVQKVDMDTRNIYLVLEGACGSCPSSTITMQMGIERTLREHFSDLGEVIAVPGEGDELPTELTFEVVEAEVNRLTPAIFAMGGTLEIVSVDPIGVVEMRFRGANKVQHGLELALRDVPLVKHVKFVS